MTNTTWITPAITTTEITAELGCSCRCDSAAGAGAGGGDDA
ncbi:StsA family sactipeptide RiPP [Kitasatospora viridis]|uniref:Uncharacterized protein n=1 Tax=Kitasatospora viridis TaxID=281105 RepID=A0A561UPZ1_9ACTN|nr:StsA family sactipeptide RiPP [Kitasatospora viridis]TWG01435.1 hypothetical protein FHX73_115328 [Kitasatospora viridis]